MSDLALRLIAENKAAYARGDESAKKLDIGNCGLTELPEELFDCGWLEELIVSNEWWDLEQGSWSQSQNKGLGNTINSLKSQIGRLRQLKILILGGNYRNRWGIADISAIRDLVALQTLYLANSRINDISFLAGLTSLQTLNLSANQIVDISFLAGLTSLQTLNLGKNQINNYSFLVGLTSLQTIDLRSNKIDDISFLAGLTSLQTIHLKSNKIGDISSLAGLTSLQTLDLSYNRISDISFLAGLTLLQTLNLSYNQISDISFLTRLTLLRTLNLSYNPISNTSFLTRLNSLQTLVLRHNQISDVSFLAGLTWLQTLNLSSNKITDVSFVPVLTSLETLNLSQNQISEIPSFDSRSKIVHLHLAENPIVKVTNIKKILELPKLEALYLYGIKENDLHIPHEQFGSKEFDNCLDHLRGYFASLSGGVARIREVPVILVGNSTVGKTSLCHFIRSGEYPPSEDYSTHGIASTIWHPDKEKSQKWGLKVDDNLQFYFWDFGGQEYYHATHRLFFSEKALYLLLWEQNTNKSGKWSTKIKIKDTEKGTELVDQNIEHFPYAYWINCIREEAPVASDSPIFLIQSKIDVEGNDQQEIPDKEVVEKNNLIPLQLSVRKAFEKSKAGGSEPYFDIFMEKVFSASASLGFTVGRGLDWEPVKKLIYAHRHEHIWTLSDFRKKLKQSEIELHESSISSFLLSLRTMGIVLYEPEVPELSNFIFINPAWALETIYDILDRKVLLDKGEFSKDQAIRKVGEDRAEVFLTLMKRFELIFNDDVEGYYVAPQYLDSELQDPKKRLTLEKKFLKNDPDYIFRFRDFVPRHIMIRFVVAYGDKAFDKYYWKKGIAFTLEETDVLVTFNPEQNEFKIYTVGADKHAQRLVFDKLVSLSSGKNSIELSLDGEQFVNYRVLQEAWELKHANVRSTGDTVIPFSQFGHFFANVSKYQKPNEDRMAKKLSIFISYAHADQSVKSSFEDKYLDPIVDYYQGKVEFWSDKEIGPATPWDKVIKNQINSSDAIIFFLSNAFLSSKYINKVERELAMERYSAKQQVIIPVYIETINGRLLPFSDKQYLPSGTPLEEWENKNKAWVEIQNGLFTIIDNLLAGKTDHYFD